MVTCSKLIIIRYVTAATTIVFFFMFLSLLFIVYDCCIYTTTWCIYDQLVKIYLFIIIFNYHLLGTMIFIHITCDFNHDNDCWIENYSMMYLFDAVNHMLLMSYLLFFCSTFYCTFAFAHVMWFFLSMLTSSVLLKIV